MVGCSFNLRFLLLFVWTHNSCIEMQQGSYCAASTLTQKHYICKQHALCMKLQSIINGIQDWDQ